MLHRVLLPCALLSGCAAAPAAIRRAPPSDPTTTTITTPVDTDAADTGGPCPDGMALAGTACIDRWEAAIDGHSPYEVPTGGVAVSRPGIPPQGYTSMEVAALACANAGKRLCTSDEWLAACSGPDGRAFPYGNTYDAAACNTSRDEHPLVSLFGDDVDWSSAQMNDPRINQQPDTVDSGGVNPRCVSADGVYDLHGNLHEWVADPDGTFRGGFYGDASLNGTGCAYATTAHDAGYHDYSTGFRCCADPL